MDKKDVLKIACEFKKLLAKQGIANSKIILFGSYAQENHREDSDIDLIVISEDFRGKDYWERIDILSEVIAEIWQPIEAVAFTPQEWERGDSIFVDFVRQGAEVIE